MSNAVATALRMHKVKAAEQAAASIGSRFPKFKPKSAENAVTFLKWCDDRGVTGLPARSETVATFVMAQHKLGVGFKTILEYLAGIEALHDVQWSNPVATGIVGAALDEIVPPDAIKAPRAWQKQQKSLFYGLPLWTQEVISRREDERDRHFLRAVNELREAKKLGSTDALLSDRALGSERQEPSGPITESAHSNQGATA